MQTNLCKICRDPFRTNLPFTKYCSAGCRQRARRLERRRYNRHCPRCGVEFTSPHPVKPIHCSIGCGASKYSYDLASVIERVRGGENPSTIADSLGVPRTAIRSAVDKAGVSYSRIRYTTSLTKFQESLIRGGLLGDAHAARIPSGKYRLSFRHGPKQYGYLDWKYHQLSTIVSTRPRTITADGAYGEESRVFATRTNHTIGVIASELYFDRIKRVSWGYLEQLDRDAMAVWFMDDGSINRYGGSLSTHSFTTQESRLIAAWLSRRYSTREPKLVLDKRCGRYSLAIHTELAHRVAAEIGPLVSSVPGMAYKTEWYSEQAQ